MKTILQSPEKKSQKLKIMTMSRKDNPEILDMRQYPENIPEI